MRKNDLNCIFKCSEEENQLHTFTNKPNGLKRIGLKAGGDNFVEPTFTCYDETSFIFLLKTSHI